MARLFLTGLFVLIVSILLAFLSVDRMEKQLYRGFNSEFFEYMNAGTFILLDDAIAGRSGADLRATVASIQDRFKYPIYFRSRQELDLPANGWAALDSGEYYMQDFGHSSQLHLTSKHTDAIWSISLAASMKEQRIMSANGVLSLVSDKLAGKNAEAQWRVVSQLQQLTDIPIALKTLEELDLPDKEIQQLQKQKIVVRNPADHGEQFWIKAGDSGLFLEAGPIDYPNKNRYVKNILDSLFYAVLLGGFLLWVWPLWRDLQRLRQASMAMGQGKLDTRVATRKTSLIRSVLDGFNQMANRTENMVASQRELTNAVSHELRTPLARMMFDLENARHTSNSQDRTRHLDSLELNIVELNTLGDELLTYAKQERVESPLELELLNEQELQDWLSNQINRAQHSHPSSLTIEFNAEIPDHKPLSFSPQLMAHALSNALQNAMRFAKSKVKVELKSQNNDWVLMVEDDGIGIPHVDRERVFESFSRLDASRDRHSGGFGLGLSIVRKIARWHHGDAHIVEPESLCGTRLEIRWPVCAELELGSITQNSTAG